MELSKRFMEQFGNAGFEPGHAIKMFAEAMDMWERCCNLHEKSNNLQLAKETCFWRGRAAAWAFYYFGDIQKINPPLAKAIKKEYREMFKEMRKAQTAALLLVDKPES